MSGVKRKRNVLNVEQKLEILQNLDNGESARKLAKDYQIGVQTVRDIKNNKEKLITFTRDCDDKSVLSKRKSLKTTTYKDLYSALLQWFNQKRADDNAPPHPYESLLESDDGLITSKFLPPNVTAAIQPMDQGVISAMKWHYRSELLKNLIHEVITLPNFWKQYSLLDAVYGISAAWSKVKSSMLSRSWRKIIPLDKQSSSDIQEEYDNSILEQGNEFEGSENLDEENLEDWFQTDACEPGFQYFTD
ncbi:Jerky -like [Araneus ventricosus]|uniref:Jerky-like n=1 Tax=Araneus ventricosus TaxID=182803 RepID=A0A4Y2HP36_ARAVE|nr:Jerky -like [Araneus ventricosus]